VPDLEGLNRAPQLLGRRRAIDRLIEVAPGRVAAYGLENHASVPVYVHAKVCVVDDLWASTGSDNFSRRSWTHDSELSAVVLDESYARDLRLTLLAEHLDRLDAVDEHGLEATMSDCLNPAEMFDVCASHAARLDEWHATDRRGPRPPGRLRRLPLSQLSARHQQWAALTLDLIHDPDGRPPALRRAGRY
jgi:phosphatidylserine/phosphatidylglycerophosphate/cardiolipin synthase-like enzyme